MNKNYKMKAYSIPSDLKVITGIGPAVEKRLHEAGIVRYDQLARMTPAELAEILSGMVGVNAASIAEKGWIEQAARMPPQVEELNPEKSAPTGNNRQHYVGFTVELLLDKDNNVRRTRAIHVQTQKEATWAGWDGDRLLDFMMDEAELYPEKASVDKPISQPRAAEIPPTVQDMERGSGFTNIPERIPASLQGSFWVDTMNFYSPQGEDLKWMIPASQPFTVRLGLDLSKLEITGGVQLQYKASIFIHQRSNGGRRELVKDHGELLFAKSTSISVTAQGLSTGKYQLEALVALSAAGETRSVRTTLFAMSESRIQVTPEMNLILAAGVGDKAPE